MVLLGVAVAAVAAGGALLAGSGEALHLTGWVLATIVAGSAIGARRILDGRRSRPAGPATPGVAKRLPARGAAMALWVVGVAIGALHLWQFADSVARP